MLVSLALSAQGIPLCKEEPFQAGEHVYMGIMYKWGAVNTEVAQARLILEGVPYGQDSVQVYHSECLVKTAPFFDVFYRMREHFQSWFVPQEHRPLEAIRDTYQNSYTAANHYIYDWEAGIIRADVAFNGQPPAWKDIPVQGMSYDIVTLIYHLRSLDWRQAGMGQSVEVPFAIDDEVYKIHVTYWGQEEFRVRKKGKFRALRFSCSLVAGAIFEGNQEMLVWFSDDDNHLPLAVMVPLKMGTMWAWLKGWEGLKFPLTAKK